MPLLQTPPKDNNTRIAQVLVSTPQATLNFGTLPTGFTHLHLYVMGRSAATGADIDNVILTFNSDTTAGNYETTMFYGGTTTGADNSNHIRAIGGIATDFTGSTAGRGGSADCTILHYTDTNFFKIWTSVSGCRQVSAQYVRTYWGQWNNVGAITTLSLSLSSGANFKAGAIATLYGIQ